MTTEQLTWGLAPHTGTRTAWGARAIYKLRGDMVVIDLLPDRQDLFGSKKDRQDLVKWVNRKGLKELRKRLLDQYVTESSSAFVAFEEKKGDQSFYIEASPRASYGYLYLVAGIQ